MEYLEKLLNNTKDGKLNEVLNNEEELISLEDLNVYFASLGVEKHLMDSFEKVAKRRGYKENFFGIKSNGQNEYFSSFLVRTLEKSGKWELYMFIIGNKEEAEISKKYPHLKGFKNSFSSICTYNILFPNLVNFAKSFDFSNIEERENKIKNIILKNDNINLIDMYPFYIDEDLTIKKDSYDYYKENINPLLEINTVKIFNKLTSEYIEFGYDEFIQNYS